MESPAKQPRKSRSRLGRGLSALVDQRESAPLEVGSIQHSEQFVNIETQDSDETHRVHEIEVGAISPNPNQPRRVFDPQALGELAESIREHGLMQPVVVRRVDAGGGEGRYELIAGERRWRAVQQAGQQRVRAIVLDVDEAQSAQLALIENIQREDLNPIERARGFALLIDRYAMTQEQVAHRVGISRPSVANLLRLLELDEEIQSLIASGLLSTGHGKALLSCKEPSRRAALARQAIDEGWSVRVLEKASGSDAEAQASHAPDDTTTHAPSATPTRVESVLRDLEKRMSEELGTRVTLNTNAQGTKGRVVIEFYDLDHFDGLLARLGITSPDTISV